MEADILHYISTLMVGDEVIYSNKLSNKYYNGKIIEMEYFYNSSEIKAKIIESPSNKSHPYLKVTCSTGTLVKRLDYINKHNKKITDLLPQYRIVIPKNRNYKDYLFSKYVNDPLVFVSKEGEAISAQFICVSSQFYATITIDDKPYNCMLITGEIEVNNKPYLLYIDEAY